jgi:hypothetical protein
MELVTDEKTKLYTLSDKLMPKPLKKPKMYRLINLGKTDHTVTNETTGKPVLKRNPFYISEGVEEIYDSGEKDPSQRNKILKNVTGQQLVTKDGKTFLQENIEPLEFVNGIKVVRPEEHHTYILLERSSKNGSNKFRNPSKIAVWEEVSEELAMEEVVRLDNIRLDAEILAKDMKFEDARAYAQKLGIKVEGASADEIRYNLKNKAKENPMEFIKGSNDGKAKRKMQISDALSYDIIAFDADINKWVFKGEKGGEICAVPVDAESPEKALDNFLISAEGKCIYKKLVDILKSPEDFS